jgi:glycosyltransferase involved in cell wall biosynthesis
VYLLASGLKKRSWQVRVVSIIPPEHFVEELEAEGIPVETLGMVRGVPDPRALWRLARILRRFRPAILHAHMIHANLLARLARLLAPVPRIICTAHNTIEVGRSFRTERSTHLAYGYTDFLCDLTTQVSMEGYRRFLEGGAARADKLRYVPNAVDVRRFIPQAHLRLTVRKELGIPEGTFCWLAVGRLEEAKDYPTLLQAFSQVAVEHPEAQLVIVGQGTLEAELKQMAGRLSLADKVRFLGSRTDVASLMNAADAFVMSSAWEGMPMVVLEAQASGLPVVATHVGGIPEVVVPGKTGYLVPPRDPDALADAMKKLMALPPEERIKMGLEGREQVVARYSLEAILDLWEEIYESLLRPRGGSTSRKGSHI